MSKTFEQGKDEIAGLCAYFATNREAFRAAGVKEAHVRQSLIDPFFEALGWNVSNNPPVAPQYREVIPEDSIDMEGQQKAPDYTFRVGTLPKFYVEAKKCGVNISADPAPAYQLRRYGWSAKVALSILTDFEELAVYDCTLRPRPGEKPGYARIHYYTFQEYPERWRELWDTFSHEAVWSGAFDQYAASKRKRGTSEVDVEFLKEIEGWRDELARNMALRNARLSGDELNRAVQLTIDRVVFLRMGEDRGLEPCEQLLTLCQRPGIYGRFMGELCRKADDKYNSGLFHFQKEAGVSEAPDQITPRLAVDDKVFKPIIQSLYFAHGSPYEFKVLPVEILGTVYERFLGKVIRLTAGHQAKVEEKPEVRKAGGVYYTPAYIVDYIVRQTVGRQIEGRTPAQLAAGTVSSSRRLRKGDCPPPQQGQSPFSETTPKRGTVPGPFRVLDMACGSGSFLLGAYQCLLDHCLKWYIDNGPERFPKAVMNVARPPSGVTAQPGAALGREPSPLFDWRLTIAEKKRILLSHVFGVDIDPQAVEVSKLSLLLKVLEGESAETVGNTMRLFHERALPNLSDNIKCGNSLIGPDYFTRDTGRLFSAERPDAEELARVNAFDWKREFPAAFPSPSGRGKGEGGGFDCVIGNPPWGAAFADTQKPYLRERYKLHSGKYESYFYFVEQATKLLSDNGAFGYIIPSFWVSRSQTKPMRDHLFGVLWPRGFVLLPENVFQGVTMDSCVVIAGRQKPGTIHTCAITRDELPGLSATALAQRTLPVSFRSWSDNPQLRFNPRISPKDSTLLERFGRGAIPFGTAVEITQGLTLYRRTTLAAMFGKAKAEEIVTQRLFHSDKMKDSTYRKELLGRNVERYFTEWNGKSWVSYGPWLAHAVNPRFFTGPRIVIQKLRNPTLRQRLVAAYLDDDQTYSAGVLLNAILRPHAPCHLFYLLGILNSKAINYWYRKSFVDVSIRVVDLAKVPIHKIDFGDKAGKANHDRMVMLVDSMLALHKQLASAKGEAQRGAIHRQIEATDAEIDRLVYDLYGLTKDEIAIVEGSNQ